MLAEDNPKEKIRYREVIGKLYHLFRAKKREIFSLYGYLLLGTGMRLAGPVIIRHAIDGNIAFGDRTGLLVSLFVYLTASFGYIFFNYKLAVNLEILAQSVLLEMKTRLVKHILGLHLGYFDKTPVGTLSARVQSDTNALRELFTQNSVMIIGDVLFFFGTLMVMLYFNVRLTLIVMFVFPLISIMAYIFFKRSGPFFVAVRKINAELSGFVNEKVHGMAAVQVFNQEKATSLAMNELSGRKFSTMFRSELMATVFFLSLELVNPGAVSAILGFGGRWAMQGGISVGTLIMFIMYVTQLLEPLISISAQLGMMQKSFAGAQRLFDVLEIKNEIPDPASPRYIKRMEHSIEFRGVSMKYAPDAPYAIRDVSFVVPKGTSCAIVGETGGGKTTILSLLFKFYTAQEGEILFDGLNINEMSKDSVRSLMGLVQQEIYLFPGTLMDNLKLMDHKIPDSRVYDAIRVMDLQYFFDKYDLKKHVSEKGSNFSQGEKQVISILRAMVMDPPVIVLDEATSSVDPYTERIIQRATERLFKDRTSITIAHRLSTIRHVDQILVVNDGRIVERGSHAELLALGGTYAKYYRLQVSLRPGEA